MPTLRVKLLEEEEKALDRLAWRERRDPRAQAALIIRHALESAGLLVGAPEPAQAQPAQPEAAR